MSETSARLQAIEGYRQLFAEAVRRGEETELSRTLAKNDLFFLLIYILGVDFANNDWVFDRCREVQAAPDGYLDLWSREHFKSTVVTMALTIQDILNDQELTVGIFSFNRPIAKGFLRQIKWQFEQNQKLKDLFPDVLYQQPEKEALKWSLDSDTPVLTTRGWKRHGDLAPGDFVFGSDGQPTEVIGISGPMENVDCYRVSFDDCDLVASGEHLWPVDVKTGPTWGDSDRKILRTTDLTCKTKKQRMPSTPVVADISPQEYTVDPYTLGLWLGNGTAGTNIISFNRAYECDGLLEISKAGYEYYVHRNKPDDNFSMYGIRGLKEKLDAIGVLRDKHVPESYLFSSQDTRRSLLQGLMDSDGTCKKDSKYKCSGTCMFSNTNENLAKAVYFLAASLGMRPSILSFMPKSRGRKIVYNVCFVGIKTNPPFRLSQKLARCKDARTKAHRYVRAIERVESRTVNCIKVAARDHLYLAGESMVVTHNSEDDGIIVKRQGTPKEATVEAWGVIDGQPTSKHYRLLIYDDVVTKESVSTPEMINKVTESVSLSFNLGSNLGGRRRFIGTRYHYADTYATLIARGAVIPRVYAATMDGLTSGEPWLWDRKTLEEKIRDQGAYIASCQLFNKPVQEGEEVFNDTWLRYWIPDPRYMQKMNKYILVDPANEKKENSDYTVMMVIGMGSDRNYYLIDMIRDKLDLRQRTNRLFALHAEYHPLAVGYEKYGMQSDISHIEGEMATRNYRFRIIPLAGSTKKNDRIKRLQPIFQQGRFYLPEKLMRVDAKGVQHDLVHEFLQDEYRQFPYMVHDDMLDCMCRICDQDMETFFPQATRDDEPSWVDSKDDMSYDFDTLAYMA